MSDFLATGGLDEMAIDINYAVFFSMFLLIAAMVLYSWWKRSLAASVFTMVLVLVDAVLIQPWAFIGTRPLVWPYDQTWQFRMRVISAIWVLLALVTTGCLVRVIRQRGVKK